jgi:hypothetical protein
MKGFDISLNLFVDHPVAAIICLLIGGGILFGLVGGMTEIEFFLINWKKLILAGILVLLLWILWDLAEEIR